MIILKIIMNMKILFLHYSKIIIMMKSIHLIYIPEDLQNCFINDTNSSSDHN